jgi:SAM-dependent methyltransferase
MEVFSHQVLFDARYYSQNCGRPYQRDEEWLDFFETIAERIVDDIAPETVLDVGCAWGFLVEALRKRGVEAFGIDVSEYAIDQVVPEMKPYCAVASITESLSRDYDLIVCIEVLEHMTRREGEAAIRNICQHTDEVVFSSSPFDYTEATHFNVQPPDYWVRLFARNGFLRDVDYDLYFISEWAVRFRRDLSIIDDVLAPYERRFWNYRKENDGIRQKLIRVEQQLNRAEQEIQEIVAQRDHQVELVEMEKRNVEVLEGILRAQQERWDRL